MTGFRLRYLGPVALITICLVTLCAVTAVSLFHEQATVTRVLRENVSSRRAAADLRGVLSVMVELEHRHVENLADLHARAQTDLREVRHYADQPAEEALADRLGSGFAEYLSRWQALPAASDPGHDPAVAEATRLLESDVLAPCDEFVAYNDRRVEESVRGHEQVLRQLAWGMATVGGLGGVAGVVAGFGVARGLSRSIRRLRVQIRDAAGKLGPEIPEILLTSEGDFHGLHAEVDRLTGRIEQVVGTLQQRDHEILRAEQLAAVGQLAAGVGHEIRNPLTSIKMLVQAGLEDGGLPGDDLQVIEGEVRRMERSLQTFLDFARPPKAERRTTDLVPLIEGVAGLLRGRAEKQKVHVTLALPAGGVTVTADGEQLRQVFVNLCLNALDAMPGGGNLTVSARLTRNSRAEIEIADDGPGISKAIFPRLFEPFVSGKETGLGLGLVISKRIVEEHAGRIAAANRRGGGASFFVTLPAG